MRPYPIALSRRLWLIKIAGFAYFVTMGQIIGLAGSRTWLELAGFVSLGVGICVCLHLHEWQKYRFLAAMTPVDCTICPKCGGGLAASQNKMTCQACHAVYKPERVRAAWQRIINAVEATYSRGYPRILARRLWRIQMAGVVSVVILAWVAKRAGRRTWQEFILFLMCYAAVFAFLYFFEWDKARFVQRIREDDCRVCPACGYKLVGLPDNGRCPECGLAYELAALREMWQRAML